MYDILKKYIYIIAFALPALLLIYMFESGFVNFETTNFNFSENA